VPILLLLVLAYSYATRPLAEPYSGATALGDPDAQSPSSERLELAISGMTCSHCVAVVTRALNDCPGVKSVHVDLSAGRAVVVGDQMDAQQLIAAVNASGYQASSC